ncbi:MAG: hypothetical protein KC493_16185 [Bacteriovoracaceae bacterium]|nr:hypothetical protein [Bacteriovoracaceae bacterium]
MSDPNEIQKTNTEANNQEVLSSCVDQLDLMNLEVSSQVRLEGQALDFVLSQIDRPTTIQ